MGRKESNKQRIFCLIYFFPDRPLTDTSDCIDSEKLDKAINGMSIEDKTTSWNSDQTADGATGGEELRRATGSLCHQSTKEQEASKSHDDHMISDARVAILFSGGIDSAVIAALADRLYHRSR